MNIVNTYTVCVFVVVFEPIWYNIHGTLDLYSDGGVLNQYPIQCFDGEYVAVLFHYLTHLDSHLVRL